MRDFFLLLQAFDVGRRGGSYTTKVSSTTREKSKVAVEKVEKCVRRSVSRADRLFCVASALRRLQRYNNIITCHKARYQVRYRAKSVRGTNS